MKSFVSSVLLLNVTVPPAPISACPARVIPLPTVTDVEPTERIGALVSATPTLESIVIELAVETPSKLVTYQIVVPIPTLPTVANSISVTVKL